MTANPQRQQKRSLHIVRDSEPSL